MSGFASKAFFTYHPVLDRGAMPATQSPHTLSLPISKAKLFDVHLHVLLECSVCLVQDAAPLSKFGIPPPSARKSLRRQLNLTSTKRRTNTFESAKQFMLHMTLPAAHTLTFKG